MSKLAIEDVGRVFPGVRGGSPTEALRPTTLAVAEILFANTIVFLV
jgi:hypothetical protein